MNFMEKYKFSQICYNSPCQTLKIVFHFHKGIGIYSSAGLFLFRHSCHHWFSLCIVADVSTSTCECCYLPLGNFVRTYFCDPHSLFKLLQTLCCLPEKNLYKKCGKECCLDFIREGLPMWQYVLEHHVAEALVQLPLLHLQDHLIV